MQPADPRIALVLVWFGPWPFWMPAFLLSCRYNPTVTWRVFSDTKPPPHLPENVKILPLAPEAFSRRATEALRFPVRVDRAFAYKLCDMKIMYGDIFREELQGVDFWGCCDMDIVWGDIRRFVTPDLLARHDVITSRPRRIAGHFCLFRNAPEWNGLYRQIPRIDALVHAPEHVATDEIALNALLKGYQHSRLRRQWARLRGRPVPRVYWGPDWSTRGRHQRRMLDDPSLALRWARGRVFGVDGQELMYLHFHKIRKHMKNINFGAGDAPDVFTVSPEGIHAVSRGCQTGGVTAITERGKL